MAVVRRVAGAVSGSGFGPQNQVVDGVNKNQFRQPLYDRVNLSTSLTGEYRFFTNPIGSTVTLIRYETAGSIQKTKRDTILATAGVDQSRDYSVQGIAVYLVPTARTVLATAATRGIRRDKDNIREGGWFQFKVVDTTILEVPLIMIPDLSAEGGVSTTGNDATAWAGPAAMGPMYNLGEAIHLPAKESFSVSINWDGTITLAQSFDMYVIFFANIRKPR